MDETPVQFDMPYHYTLDVKGEQKITLKTKGGEKKNCTVVLCISMTGEKIKPFIIFKRKRIPKTKPNGDRFPISIVAAASPKGWMNTKLMKEWIDNAFSTRTGNIWRPPSLLILDTFAAHCDVKYLKKHNIHCLFIPGGLTPILQPLDKGINRPFKHYLKSYWNAFISMESKKMATIFQVSHWVKESWHSIESKIIVKSFYTCLKTVSGSTDDEEVSDSDDDQEEDNEEDGEEDGEDEIEIIEEENYVF
eukprot:TRINITY_DN4584_c0_g1_i4.p1 TRINITY_DN4584_c0_g1~~TRINITY_DN4584_c0_g1_i4.p1  ORF type:complete len:283 (-),score=42.87 TRINITY_DN4584_c0_g1_i4:4-750(-)